MKRHIKILNQKFGFELLYLDIFEEFIQTNHRTSNFRTSLKQKYARCNAQLFKSKELSKAIMYRSDIQKKISGKELLRIKKVRNTCVSLLRRAKSWYFSNIDEQKFCDSKSLWKNGEAFAFG